MVQTKKMNEQFFVKLQKDFTTTGELIRARQDEKQSLLDEFDLESKRFFFGKISQKSLLASIKKTNDELHRLDKSIRDSIKKSRSLSRSEEHTSELQSHWYISYAVFCLKKKKKKKNKKK